MMNRNFLTTLARWKFPLGNDGAFRCIRVSREMPSSIAKDTTSLSMGER